MDLFVHSKYVSIIFRAASLAPRTWNEYDFTVVPFGDDSFIGRLFNLKAYTPQNMEHQKWRFGT